MRAAIRRYDAAAEFHTPELCHINELANCADDPDVSIARARVEPGVTTRWHRVNGTAERYVILEGRGRVEVGDLAPQDVRAGDVVLIPPSCRQRIANIGESDLVFLAICTPRFRPEAYEEVDDDVSNSSHATRKQEKGMQGALEDITVLDLGQVIAMPFCTMLLADMGAKVIKVESRERGVERMALGIKRERNGRTEKVHAAQYRDRNKLGVTLDLKQPQGVALFKELAERADVITENFSVGAMARLGLGYEDMKRVNPRIVYASITAFGQEGPYAKQRGYDMLAQAISGFMSINGFPDGPPTRAGQSISDYYAGMLCAFSIVSALRHRDRTGKGQHIDIALLDSMIIALDNLGERYTVGGEVLTRAGNVAFGGSASGIYAATDGHVAIAASTSDLVWRRFCKLVGRTELTTDPGYATVPARRDNQQRIVALIQEWTGARSKAEVVKALSEAGVPAAAVNNVAEMVADPQVRAREMFVDFDHPAYGALTLTGTPLKLSETPGTIRTLAPEPGEHNEEVFVRLLGHTPDELAQWKADGVI